MLQSNAFNYMSNFIAFRLFPKPKQIDIIPGFYVGQEGPMFYIGAVTGSGVSQVR